MFDRNTSNAKPKLAVGDLVRCIKKSIFPSHHETEVGKVYLVAATSGAVLDLGGVERPGHTIERFSKIVSDDDWRAGDIVEVVNNEHHKNLVIGDFHTITAVRGLYIDIDVAVFSGGWLKSRFRLVPHNRATLGDTAKALDIGTRALDIGTRLRCLSPGSHSKITPGKTYVVNKRGWRPGISFIINDDEVLCAYEDKLFEVVPGPFPSLPEKAFNDALLKDPILYARPQFTPKSSARGKTWIIASEVDGKLAPNNPPKEYSSDRQARRVARDMAEKHRGVRFVILEGVGEVTVPKSEASLINY